MSNIAQIKGGVGQSISHDSVKKHASGTAVYVDDIPTPENTLHLYAFPSPHAHAEITKIDLREVEAAEGVALVLTAGDITGLNDVSPTHSGDDPLLADGKVVFQGQAIFAVAANTMKQAISAAKLAKIEYKALPAILSIEQALAENSFVFEPQIMAQGDAEKQLKTAKNKLSGTLNIGGQDHFYLEGQISLVVPKEEDFTVHCSTQHPSEVQAHVAQVLGVERNAVTVEVRRMGGGFGGKETQASPWAALAALTAQKTGRPAKMRLVRDDDMIMTGKRHPFQITYEVGFDDNGLLDALNMTLVSDCGHSLDLSRAINDRALFHSDNCYFIPNMKVKGLKCRTNKVSNTAFRGFGGPQGMMAIEEVMDQVAKSLGKDPLEVRQTNLYGATDRNTTHYGMVVEDNVIPQMIEQLKASSNYGTRKTEISKFNAGSEFIKKGIALTPLKFGISFTTKFLNQAGALIHIYADGSVQLNHGGTEMGQGLFTKVAQIVANTLNIDLKHIKITATNTGKVPNTSPTAASSGTDMNGMAAKIAAEKLIKRLRKFACEYYKVADEQINFANNCVKIADKTISFKEFVHTAYMERTQLSATGYYATPKIDFDPETGKGRPFLYFSYGAAVSEVEVDTLTGEAKLLQVDILHDVGKSLNPTIDLGQIEGGFMQGLGWLTNEELFWNEDGVLKTHAPSTYKIPTTNDRPDNFNISLFANENSENTVYKSKAVGEPPLMLGISAYRAIWQAVNGNLNAPATPEAILKAWENTP